MVMRSVALCIASLFAGWGGAQITVAVSIAPYGDLVDQIAGPLARVTVVLPPGASPHTFEPTPRATAALSGAHLVVLNGGLDEWLLRMLEAVDPTVPVFEALEALGEDRLAVSAGADVGGSDDPEHLQGEHEELEEEDEQGHVVEEHEHDDVHGGESEQGDHDQGDHDHAGVNPHVWLDPVLASEIVLELGRALARVDETNARHYVSNSERLSGELLELDVELRELLAPLAGAPFVPFHDAWPYFASRYSLNLLLEIEPFPGREPSPRYLAEAVRAIRDSRAPAIFNEEGLPDRPARVLAQEAGVGLYRLDPLGRTGESYQELLRRNARTVREGLSGWQAP